MLLWISTAAACRFHLAQKNTSTNLRNIRDSKNGKKKKCRRKGEEEEEEREVEDEKRRDRTNEQTEEWIVEWSLLIFMQYYNRVETTDGTQFSHSSGFLFIYSLDIFW